MSRHERVVLDGPDGAIELFVENQEAPQGIALIAHPHPLFGGTADNKVVTTLARTFREKGCITLRPNFRGVGGSVGAHDNGGAETEDLLAVHAWAFEKYGDLPLYLAGFSFGAFVITRVAKRLSEAGTPARRIVLVGTAAGFVEGDKWLVRIYHIHLIDTAGLFGDAGLEVVGNLLHIERDAEIT